jgi:hypothetical protein
VTVQAGRAGACAAAPAGLNRLPAAGVAVSVAVLPASKLMEQAAPQSLPLPLDAARTRAAASRRRGWYCSDTARPCAHLQRVDLAHASMPSASVTATVKA